MHNYIFDLDGTLLDSSLQVLLCLKEACILSNCSFDKSKLNKDIIGPPLKQIIKIIVDTENEDLVGIIQKNFRKIYDNLEQDVSKVYDGVYEVLGELKSKNSLLFIATFKPSIPTYRILKQYNLEKYFNDIYTIDKNNNLLTKENMIRNIIDSYGLNRQNTVMIGDTLSDIVAAKKANITAIAALWGYTKDKEDMIKISDYSIQNIKEIIYV